MRRSVRLLTIIAFTVNVCGFLFPQLGGAEDVIQQTGANSTTVTESHDSNGNSNYESSQSKMVPTVTRTHEEINGAGQTETVTEPLVQERRERTVDQTIVPGKVETETKVLPPTLIESREKVTDTSSSTKKSSRLPVHKTIVRRPIIIKRHVAARPVRRSVASTAQSHQRVIERDRVYQQPVVIERRVTPGSVSTTTSEHSAIDQSGN